MPPRDRALPGTKVACKAKFRCSIPTPPGHDRVRAPPHTCTYMSIGVGRRAVGASPRGRVLTARGRTSLWRRIRVARILLLLLLLKILGSAATALRTAAGLLQKRIKRGRGRSHARSRRVRVARAASGGSGRHRLVPIVGRRPASGSSVGHGVLLRLLVMRRWRRVRWLRLCLLQPSAHRHRRAGRAVVARVTVHGRLVGSGTWFLSIDGLFLRRFLWFGLTLFGGRTASAGRQRPRVARVDRVLAPDDAVLQSGLLLRTDGGRHDVAAHGA